LLRTKRKSYKCALEALDTWKNNHINGDTETSKRIFDIEEGKEDRAVCDGTLRHNGKRITHRRDWLVLADIYNNGNETQEFHLRNYIEFKLHDGATEGEPLQDGMIRNAALYLFVREVIYEDSEEVIDEAREKVVEFYNCDANLVNRGAKVAREVIAKYY